MSTQEAEDCVDLLESSLDRLILGTRIFESRHGQGSRAIQQTSEERLLVEHGAPDPALERLEGGGGISVKWELPQITGRRGFIP
jgi:hypothetical protein